MLAALGDIFNQLPSLIGEITVIRLQCNIFHANAPENKRAANMAEQLNLRQNQFSDSFLDTTITERLIVVIVTLIAYERDAGCRANVETTFQTIFDPL